MNQRRSFWQELKERRVVKVALAYAVVAFAVMQAATAFFPALHLPDWTTTLVAALAVLGFPIAIVLSWLFQVTPEGITRAPATSSGRPLSAGAIAVVGAVVVLAGAGGAFVFWPRPNQLDRNRVVVATFENRTGDPALEAVGSMAADWLTQGMIQASLGEVIDRTALTGESAQGKASTTPVSLARATGAGTVIGGSYYKQGDSLYIRAQLIDANTGDIISSLEPVSAPASTPVRAVEQLRTRVLSALATALSVPSTGTTGLTLRPPTYDAYRAYEEGSRAPVGAEKTMHLARAVALDSTFNLARIAQVRAYAMVSDTARADSVIAVLERVRDRLTPLERALFDRQRGFAHDDRVGTYEAAKRIAALSPSRTAALEALRLNRPREAIAEAERVYPATRAADWFEYYSWVAAAQHMLGEYKSELRTVRRSAKDHPNQVERYKAEVRALAALDRPEKALARVKEHDALPVSEIPRFLVSSALELRAHGHTTAADTVFARLLGWYDAQPAAWRAAVGNRLDLAFVYYYAGRDAQANALLDSLHTDMTASPKTFISALSATSVALRVEPRVLGALGVLAARRGDREEAERIATLLEQPPFSTASGLGRLAPGLWRGRIAARLGQKDKALSLLREIMHFALVQSGDAANAHVDPDLDSLRGWKPFDDLMRPKN